MLLHTNTWHLLWLIGDHFYYYVIHGDLIMYQNGDLVSIPKKLQVNWSIKTMIKHNRHTILKWECLVRAVNYSLIQTKNYKQKVGATPSLHGCGKTQHFVLTTSY